MICVVLFTLFCWCWLPHPTCGWRVVRIYMHVNSHIQRIYEFTVHRLYQKMLKCLQLGNQQRRLRTFRWLCLLWQEKNETEQLNSGNPNNKQCGVRIGLHRKKISESSTLYVFIETTIRLCSSVVVENDKWNLKI